MSGQDHPDALQVTPNVTCITAPQDLRDLLTIIGNDLVPQAVVMALKAI
jgi:hypothetical protein